MPNLGAAIICLVAACGVTQLIGGYDLDSAAVASPDFRGTTGNCAAAAKAPSTAAAAGFGKLVFCDDFDSLSTIDVNTTGAPGYNWYTRLPRGEGRTPQSDYSISNSVLAITAPDSYNFAITTKDVQSGNGNSWTFGYFEARLCFDPNAVPTASGWPAWWGNSAHHLRYDTRYKKGQYIELDFFEAPPKARTEFAGTLHQFKNNGAIHYQNSNNIPPVSVNWAKWHTVGVLWVPGRVDWYLDGKRLIEQQYSANAQPRPLARTMVKGPQPAGLFSSLDTEMLGEQMILGSAQGWPLNVDWVRVWH
jgi:beta-glucanase (GH16 family)